MVAVTILSDFKAWEDIRAFHKLSHLVLQLFHEESTVNILIL